MEWSDAFAQDSGLPKESREERMEIENYLEAARLVWCTPLEWGSENLAQHQRFAEALCWGLAMHTVRKKKRNNALVPPSLLWNFFKVLGQPLGGSKEHVLRACFPKMDDADFSRYWHGRAEMDVVVWKSHLLRLQREGCLPKAEAATFLEECRYLNLGYAALAQCRSALNKATWADLVETNRSLLFSWPDPTGPFIRLTLDQPQAWPWAGLEDALDRCRRPEMSLTGSELSAVKWWPDRGALVFRLGITRHPLRFDKQTQDKDGWAVRLELYPYYDVYKKTKTKPRDYVPSSYWGELEEEDMAEVRRRYRMFRDP